MGNQGSSSWKACSVTAVYGFRYEKSCVIGLHLNPLWDELPTECKYMVDRSTFLNNSNLRSHVQLLYRHGLAFAVQSFGDKRFHVSNTLNIDAHAYFSFVYIACTPEYLFSLIDRVNEEAICAKEELYTRLELRLLKAL